MEFRKFDYIDRVHSSQYDFIRIPKAMMDNDGFFGALSIQAKLLYGLLCLRMFLMSRWRIWQLSIV